jgi:hypothetical protein
MLYFQMIGNPVDAWPCRVFFSPTLQAKPSALSLSTVPFFFGLDSRLDISRKYRKLYE